jgi:hypothetical protein
MVEPMVRFFKNIPPHFNMSINIFYLWYEHACVWDSSPACSPVVSCVLTLAATYGYEGMRMREEANVASQKIKLNLSHLFHVTFKTNSTEVSVISGSSDLYEYGCFLSIDNPSIYHLHQRYIYLSFQ